MSTAVACNEIHSLTSLLWYHVKYIDFVLSDSGEHIFLFNKTRRNMPFYIIFDYILEIWQNVWVIIFFFLKTEENCITFEFYAHKRSRWYMRIFMIFKHLLKLRQILKETVYFWMGILIKLYSLHFIFFFLEKQEIRVSIFFLIQCNELLYYLNVVQYQQSVHHFCICINVISAHLL